MRIRCAIKQNQALFSLSLLNDPGGQVVNRDHSAIEIVPTRHRRS